MMRYGWVTVSALVAISVVLSASSPRLPELPRITLDTRMPTVSGRRVPVRSGRDLQRAIADARPGDVLELEAGSTFVGNFELPRKTGTGWIIIRSDADGKLPPEGTRVAPAHAGAMARILSPNELPAIRTVEGAHHYRLIGIEVSTLPEVLLSRALIDLGDGSREQNALDLVPHDLILDRVYVHGHPALHLKRCVVLNSASTAVIDSYLAECHGRGQDTQAIGGWNGPGPFKIVNNYLEGAGENVMFGGADPAINGLVPSDIEIRRNHFVKPMAWKGVWTVKNLLELKNAQRVLVEGNVLENSWVDGQIGFAVVMWSVNQSGRCTWCVTQDVTFRYNRVRNVAGGFQLNAKKPSEPSPIMQRVLIAHNVLTDVGAPRLGNNGRMFQINGPIVDLTIEHNTAFSTNHLFTFVERPPKTIPGIVIRDNIGGARYNVFSSAGQGARAVQQYFGTGGVFAGNVLVGRTKPEPPGNRFAANPSAVGFVDYQRGNFRLSTGSPFRGRATNGKDPGADFPAVERQTAGVVIP